MDEKEYLIPFDAVAKAKLVLTDELFEEYMKDHNVVFKYAFWNPSKAPVQDENQASS